MFESCVDLTAEYNEVERQLANPDVHGDQAAARRLGRRYAELRPVVAAYREWVTATGDLAAARELVEIDPSFADEVASMEVRTDAAAEHLRALLLPRDPMDDKDIIVEVKAGEGGEESALFAGDLARMYLRYAERRGWNTQVLEAVESDLGGYKDIANAVKGAKGGSVEFRVEKAGIIQAGIGKASFSEEKLVENIKALADAVVKAKPAGSKGTYVQRVAVSSTMGPGVKVEPGSLNS